MSSPTQIDKFWDTAPPPPRLTLIPSPSPTPRCGKCRRYMKLVETRPQRLHCTNCGETFSLPSDGVVRIYNETKCPLDEFELVVWSGGKKGRSFVLCPYCYNNPPFE